MNTLPPEVLVIVFQHLHFLEKVECLGVCKSSAESIIPKLLKYSVFGKLKMVSTCSITDHYSELIPTLKNAPNLVDLDLKVGELSLFQLNEVHNHTPQIKHLALEFQRNSHINDDIYINNINPADNLRTLKISNISAIPNRCLMSYAITKYNHLTKFTYSNRSMDSTADPVLMFIKYCGPTLIKLNLDIKRKSTDIVDAIINYTPQLNNLSIRCHNDMDEIKIKIKNIHKDSHHIFQSLSIKDLPAKLKLSDIQHLTHLSCLDLDFTNIKTCKTIPKQLLIQKLPKSVKNLALRNCQVSTAKKGTKGISLIGKTTLANINCINRSISSLLSHFPNLNTLIIDKCDMESTLSLQEHVLQTVEFIPTLYPRFLNTSILQQMNLQMCIKYQSSIQPRTIIISSQSKRWIECFIEVQ
jgi:hypothetical protein